MATYKVIQDIEAEDKLLGPLTLRQFIYAAIVVVLGFVCFKLAQINPLLTLPFLPPMIFFGMLAAPFGHDQSSEVWLLAKIRFFLKPRRRIWDQSGMQQLVTITAPKKVERVLTDGLSQTEVKSRLQALANTIDSRGWAIKNVNVNLFSQPTYLSSGSGSSDRLIDTTSLPQEVPSYDVSAADDILDERNNPTAQQLNSMINQSAQAHYQAAVQSTQGGGGAQQQAPSDYWFMNQPDPGTTPPGYATFTQNPTIAPGMASDSTANPVSDIGTEEQALLEQVHKDKAQANTGYGHTRVIDPAGHRTTHSKPAHKAKHSTHQDDANAHAKDENEARDTSPKRTDPAILRLARNDDLNVATIAREAEKSQKPPDDEVVITLR